MVDGGFVETSDGAERAGYEMQLVLDDQIGWIELPTVIEWATFAPCVVGPIETDPFDESVDVTEEGAGLADPWQACELVDGGDQKCRQTSIDRLVDC